MKKISPILIFILLILGIDLFSYIPIVLFHININNLSMTMRIIYTLCTDIGFMIIIFTLYRKELIENFKYYFKNFTKIFSTSFNYYIIGLIIMYISNNLIAIFFSNATPNNENMTRLLIDKYPLYMLFSVAIYAPFIEEIIFRKSIKDVIDNYCNNNKNKYIYIIISGLLFGAMHVIGMSSTPIDYLYIIPYMALGCSFAITYTKTNNIFSTITMHSLHNLIAIITYFMIGG